MRDKPEMAIYAHKVLLQTLELYVVFHPVLAAGAEMMLCGGTPVVLLHTPRF